MDIADQHQNGFDFDRACTGPDPANPQLGELRGRKQWPETVICRCIAALRGSLRYLTVANDEPCEEVGGRPGRTKV